MAISGDKAAAIFKRYNKIDPNHGRDAMRKVETYLSGIQVQEKEIDYFNITSSFGNGNAAFA